MSCPDFWVDGESECEQDPVCSATFDSLGILSDRWIADEIQSVEWELGHFSLFFFFKLIIVKLLIWYDMYTKIYDDESPFRANYANTLFWWILSMNSRRFSWLPNLNDSGQIWIVFQIFLWAVLSFNTVDNGQSSFFFLLKKNAECFYLTTETCNSVIQSFAAIGEFICFWPQMVFCLNKARDCIYVDIGSFVSVKGPYIFEFIVYFWFFVQDH